MNRSTAALLLLAFLGLAACDGAPKVEPAVSNELKAVPGTPVVKPPPVVRPQVNGRTGVADDGVRPAPQKLRTGIPDDSIKPAPKP